MNLMETMPLGLRPDANHSYEYMMLAGWSEGVVYNNKESFSAYVEKCAREYNTPIQCNFIKTEEQ